MKKNPKIRNLSTFTPNAVAIALFSATFVVTNMLHAYPFPPKHKDYDDLRWTRPSSQPNNAYFKAGMVNVVDYGATPNNSNDDDGPKIQNALDDAYNNHLVCYFPSGTYHVKDPLECAQAGNNRRHTYVLLGEKGTRPVLKIRSNATAFNNASNPTPFLKIWTFDDDDPDQVEQGNIGFNNVIRGIDFNLSGKAGASAIYFCGAQGCSVEDVRIDATGAHSGFMKSIGVNGGYYNIEVQGGKHALYFDFPSGSDSLFPILAGCRFFDQTDEVMYNSGRSPITFVGFHIKKASGPVFETSHVWHEQGGNIALLDGVIEITGSAGVAIDNQYNQGGDNRGRNVYMRDVYVHNSNTLVQQPDGTNESGTSGGWTKVGEYGWGMSGPGVGTNGRSLINGSQYTKGISQDITRNYNGSVPSGDDCVNRHIWDEANFPAWDDANVYDAVEDGGLDNTGATDVTTSLNNMLINNDIVFLPKGIYKISNTINIPGDTKFFGISRTISVLRPNTNVWDPSNEEYIITTDSNPNAAPLLSNIWIEFAHKKGSSIKGYMLSLINWRAGRESMIRNTFGYDNNGTGNAHYADGLNKKLYKFSENAGGRIYGLTNAWQNTSMASTHNSFRAIYVTGTSEPLNFYGFNVERQMGTYQAEFNNASNINVFGGKTEGENPKVKNNQISWNQHHTPMIGIVDCTNVIVATVATSVSGCENGWIQIIDSDDVVSCNITSQNHNNFSLIHEEYFTESTHTINANNYQMPVFARGNANLNTDFTSGGGSGGGGGGSGGNIDATAWEGPNPPTSVTGNEQVTIKVKYSTAPTGDRSLNLMLTNDESNFQAPNQMITQSLPLSNGMTDAIATFTVTIPDGFANASAIGKWRVRLMENGVKVASVDNIVVTGVTVNDAAALVDSMTAWETPTPPTEVTANDVVTIKVKYSTADAGDRSVNLQFTNDTASFLAPHIIDDQTLEVENSQTDAIATFLVTIPDGYENASAIGRWRARLMEGSVKVAGTDAINIFNVKVNDTTGFSYQNLFEGTYNAEFTDDFQGDTASFDYNNGDLRNSGNAGTMVTLTESANWGDYQIKTKIKTNNGPTNHWNDAPAVVFRVASDTDYQAINIRGDNNKIYHSDSGIWKANSSTTFDQSAWTYLLIRVVGTNIKVWASSTVYPDGTGTPDIDNTFTGMPSTGAIGFRNYGTATGKWEEIYIDSL